MWPRISASQKNCFWHTVLHCFESLLRQHFDRCFIFEANKKPRTFSSKKSPQSINQSIDTKMEEESHAWYPQSTRLHRPIPIRFESTINESERHSTGSIFLPSTTTKKNTHTIRRIKRWNENQRDNDSDDSEIEHSLTKLFRKRRRQRVNLAPSASFLLSFLSSQHQITPQ